MTEELKGGKLAQRAAILCHDANFRLWLDRRRKAKFGFDIPDGTHTEQDAKEFILQACGIESRRELDHNQIAAKRFKYVIHHFNKFLRRLNQS